MLDPRLVLMLAAGTLLLLNGLIGGPADAAGGDGVDAARRAEAKAPAEPPPTAPNA